MQSFGAASSSAGPVAPVLSRRPVRGHPRHMQGEPGDEPAAEEDEQPAAEEDEPEDEPEAEEDEPVAEEDETEQPVAEEADETETLPGHFEMYVSSRPDPARSLTGRTRVCLVSFGVKTAMQTAQTFWDAHRAFRRAVFSDREIAREVRAVWQSLGINFPPVEHIFDARDFRPPWSARPRGPPAPSALAGHSGWHPEHVQSMLEDYPAALDNFRASLPVLWKNLDSGPVTIVAFCLAGEMRSVCMTRVLACMLSAFPNRRDMDLQVYHLSALSGALADIKAHLVHQCCTSRHPWHVP